MPARLASWIVIALAMLAAPAGAGADGLMLVPAGVFWMGRDGGAPDEAPLHRVFVTDFWIERHKVTNAEFAAFLNATGLRPPGAERRYDEDDGDARIHRREGRFAADPGFEDHPEPAPTVWRTCSATFASGHPLALGLALWDERRA
jgi:formylglycine-generating enzyme required for sulfatase activity